MQESGNWKEAQEQLLRYQLARQNQLLLLCPDLKEGRLQLQGQSQLGKEGDSLGPSQERKTACDASVAVHLHSAHPDPIPEQL